MIQGGDSPRIVGRSGAACGLDVPYLTLQCCKPLAQCGRVRDDGLDFLRLLGLQRGEGLDGLKRQASVLLQALFYGVDSGRHSFQGPVYLFPDAGCPGAFEDFPSATVALVGGRGVIGVSPRCCGAEIGDPLKSCVGLSRHGAVEARLPMG